MNENAGLGAIGPGETATVTGLTTQGEMRRRLLDIGLTENTKVECVGKSPFGDPCAYLIRGAVIALRREDSRGILIERCRGGRSDGTDR